MDTIFICGNGNITFEEFNKWYIQPLEKIGVGKYSYRLGDFKGTDMLTMEYLKDKTRNVSIYHLFNNPRYKPDKLNTKSLHWSYIGGYKSDKERDIAMISNSGHYLAYDKNTNKNHISGTYKNIQLCKKLNKINVIDLI